MTRTSSTAICLAVVLLSIHPSLAQPDDRAAQRARLQSQRIIVPTTGWPAEQFAPAIVAAGYTVVNAPHGNDIAAKRDEVQAWSAAGLKMLVRPTVPVDDPFDPRDVERGCEQLKHLIAHYDKHPDVIGFTLAWGQTDEGGFPFGYKFSTHARNAFNRHENTPAQPLPQPPSDGHPGSPRWVRWLKFRSATLVEFRKTFVAAAKQATDKLVGTWSEFYPVTNYVLNMGDAPGADFLMYDLSFGDVTADQRIAFGECHGGMELFPDFESWRNHEVPLIAKAAGEGVTPVAFQFPMRRGFQHPNAQGVLIDRVQDEYCLRIAPEIHRLTNASHRPPPEPQVALVYGSFAAAGLPAGEKHVHFYQGGCRQIEGALHQMGVHMRVVPIDLLATTNLAAFKLVIVPNPVYLDAAMQRSLQSARRVLYAGEFLLAHHDPTQTRGNYNTAWEAHTTWPHGQVQYKREPAATLDLDSTNPMLEGLDDLQDTPYPDDQVARFTPLPPGARVLIRAGTHPMLITCDANRTIYLTNRLFAHAYASPADTLEHAAFKLLRQLLRQSDVDVRVAGPPLCRVNHGNKPYGSYGLTGFVAWNTTPTPLTLNLHDKQQLTVPAYGWKVLPRTTSTAPAP